MMGSLHTFLVLGLLHILQFDNAQGGRVSRSGSAKIYTTDGSECIFPFTFKGTTYHSCAPDAPGPDWCPTQLMNYDITYNYAPNTHGFCKAVCPGGCVHGQCKKHYECTCSPGYTGDTCNTPDCPGGCVHGQCKKPYECTCSPGYTGYTCNTPIRVCFGDSISFGSQCLTFSAEDDKLSWNNAAAACAFNGGRLATLEHPDDIHYYITENYPRDTYFWIGATDAENEGSWVWTVGQPLGDQFPWRTGEPNLGTVENCLFVAAAAGYYDGRCSSTIRYICEVRPF